MLLLSCPRSSPTNLVIIFTAKAVADRVLALDAFRKSKTISCYLSMPTMELDTSTLVQEIVRSSE